MTPETTSTAGFKTEQSAHVAAPSDLAAYDAIIFGTPIRLGNMASQMRSFLDQTRKMWMEGALIGKVGSVFTSTGTGGDSETTITSFGHTLAHNGMIITGLRYSNPVVQLPYRRISPCAEIEMGLSYRRKSGRVRPRKYVFRLNVMHE